ncbi:CsgE family curli-type amyloid fiber assembly protein [Lutibacter sp.]|uniref:CsgE family curli-type amyloid fiber assembly protein n=1 Tax=Lutibacter sp. TaxID=1925666 RepID=UPI0035646B1C
MKPLAIRILLSFLILSSSFAISQVNDAIVGRINLFENDNMLTIMAQVENFEPFFVESLSYNLVALKKSASGNYSNNKQAGEFSLMANEKRNISEINLNLNEDEELQVYLFIKQNNHLVSKDTLYLFPKHKQLQEQAVVPEEEFMLKGIVVESVITKIGKDFYDYFYQDYLTSGSKYPFIIYISEKPYYGRSSIITIMIDDRTIYEFMTQPDEEFLKSEVKTSLQYIYQYSRQRKMLFKSNKI